MIKQAGTELPKELVALVDGDIVAYRAAMISERTKYLVWNAWDGKSQAHADHLYTEFETAKEAKAWAKKTSVIWSRKEDLGVELALEAAESTMKALLEKTGSSTIEVFLSGKNNYRDGVAFTTPYKGSREFITKPKYLRACREYLIKAWGAVICDGYEADDGIGIRATEIGDKFVICTIDKDLDQIPGWHYDWVKGSIRFITKREADFGLCTQILTGDPTDDVPGLAGIGPVKAKRILEGAKNSRELYERVWAEYRDNSGKTLPDAWDYFCEQATLVYILRDRYYDPTWPEFPDGLSGTPTLKDIADYAEEQDNSTQAGAVEPDQPELPEASGTISDSLRPEGEHQPEREAKPVYVQAL